MDSPKPRSRAALLFKQAFRKLDAAASSLTVATRPETATKPTVDESKVERITFKLRTVPYGTLEDLYLDVVTELGCRQGSCHHSHLIWFSGEGTACDHPQRSPAQDKLSWLSDEDIGYLARALPIELERRYQAGETNTPPKLRLITDGDLVGLSKNVVNNLVYRQQNFNNKQIEEEPSNSAGGTVMVLDYPRNEPQQELSSFFTEDVGGLAHSLLYEIGDRHPDWEIKSPIMSSPSTGNAVNKTKEDHAEMSDPGNDVFSIVGDGDRDPDWEIKSPTMFSPSTENAVNKTKEDHAEISDPGNDVFSIIGDETETLVNTPTSALRDKLAIFQQFATILQNSWPSALEEDQDSKSYEMVKVSAESSPKVPGLDESLLDDTTSSNPIAHEQGEDAATSRPSSYDHEQSVSHYESLETLTPIPIPEFTDFSLSLLAEELYWAASTSIRDEVQLPVTSGKIASVEGDVTKLVLPPQARKSWRPAQETEMGSPVSPERVSPLEPREDTRRNPFNRNSRFCLDGLVTDKSKFVAACGGYSDVWKGKLGERLVAIKVLRGFDAIGDLFAQKKMLKRLWREYLAWSSLSHPNIIECLGFTYDFVHESQYKVPALISPWMSHGTVLSYIQKNPNANRMNLIVGITQGLCYLHKRASPIIHGDIRAGNILVSDNGVACFTDFGLARILQNEVSLTTSTDAAGSLRWMAPELFNSAKISEASDVWAYGMTVLEILTGKRPYADIALEPAVLRRVLEGHSPSKPSPSEAPSATEQLWDICLRCWAFRPDDRPSISEIAFEFVTEEKYREWQRLSDQR